MKSVRSIGLMYLCAFLLLCTACTPVGEASPTPMAMPTVMSTETPMPSRTPVLIPTQTPVPTPVPTLEPTPEPTLVPASAVSDLLESVFSCDGWAVRAGIFPGSGPVTFELEAADCGDRLREILTGLDWQKGEGEDVLMEEYRKLDKWVQFSSISGDFEVLPKNDTVVFRFKGEPFGEAVYHANGTENLCKDLLDLWPGPEAYYFRAKAEPGKDAQAMAENYAAAFEAVYRESGAITDFRMDAVTGKLLNESYYTVDISFAVKPANPNQRAWKGWAAHRVTIDSNGWAKYTCRITLGAEEAVLGRFEEFQYK